MEIKKVGFLGMGVMGLPMVKNVIKKCGLPVLGFDVNEARLKEFQEAGGIAVEDVTEIYKQCDVILQILPTPSSFIPWSRPLSTASPATSWWT